MNEEEDSENGSFILDSRAPTADIAQNLLNDFFKSNDYTILRTRHNNKGKSRGLPSKGILKKVSSNTPLLSPLLNRSISLNSLEQQQTIDSNQRSVYSRLNNRISFEDPPQTPGLGINGEIHKQPINVDDFHSVNSVMHRVSFVSGSLPGNDIRRAKTPGTF